MLKHRTWRLAIWFAIFAINGSADANFDHAISGSVPVLLNYFVGPNHADAAQPNSIWVAPLTDRHLTVEQRSAPVEADLVDAILRIEGIYDPTRIGIFGRSIRMEVRAGTASMDNVFADSWTTADTDPNVHVNVPYLAFVWHHRGSLRCEDVSRFRPDESLIVFNMLSPTDCRRFLEERRGIISNLPTVATSFGSTPMFASPYPGGRLSAADLLKYQTSRINAVKERLLLKRRILQSNKKK